LRVSLSPGHSRPIRTRRLQIAREVPTLSVDTRRPAIAVELVRRMKGIAHPFLMECDDDHSYVVKFKQNFEGTLSIVCDYLGTAIARRLGVPSAVPEVVRVPDSIIGTIFDLYRKMGWGKFLGTEGLHFGSRLPERVGRLPFVNIPEGGRWSNVENLKDFAGMLLFDLWTGNVDHRQVVFFLPEDHLPYQAVMVDQGRCFHGGTWKNTSMPVASLYTFHGVYWDIRSLDDFEPWLSILESEITYDSLVLIAMKIPEDWYGKDWGIIEGILQELYKRRKLVRRWLIELIELNLRSFPNWNTALPIVVETFSQPNHGAAGRCNSFHPRSNPLHSDGEELA
jgi:hypothetical protein